LFFTHCFTLFCSRVAAALERGGFRAALNQIKLSGASISEPL
jgi:hypothetical protein